MGCPRLAVGPQRPPRAKLEAQPRVFVPRGSLLGFVVGMVFAGLWPAARLGAAAGDPALSIDVPSQMPERISARSVEACGAAWCGGQRPCVQNRQAWMSGFR